MSSAPVARRTDRDRRSGRRQAERTLVVSWCSSDDDASAGVVRRLRYGRVARPGARFAAARSSRDCRRSSSCCTWAGWIRVEHDAALRQRLVGGTAGLPGSPAPGGNPTTARSDPNRPARNDVAHGIAVALVIITICPAAIVPLAVSGLACKLRAGDHADQRARAAARRRRAVEDVVHTAIGAKPQPARKGPSRSDGAPLPVRTSRFRRASG